MRSSADQPSRPNMNFGKTLLDRSLRPNLRVKDGTFCKFLYLNHFNQHLIHYPNQYPNHALKEDLLHYREV